MMSVMAAPDHRSSADWGLLVVGLLWVLGVSPAFGIWIVAAGLALIAAVELVRS